MKDLQELTRNNTRHYHNVMQITHSSLTDNGSALTCKLQPEENSFLMQTLTDSFDDLADH